jgi:hypothetical protein
MTKEDMFAVIAAAANDPSDANMKRAISAMRSNPPVSAKLMRSLPKGMSNKYAAQLDAFWRKGERY